MRQWYHSDDCLPKVIPWFVYSYILTTTACSSWFRYTSGNVMSAPNWRPYVTSNLTTISMWFLSKRCWKCFCLALWTMDPQTSCSEQFHWAVVFHWTVVFLPYHRMFWLHYFHYGCFDRRLSKQINTNCVNKQDRTWSKTFSLPATQHHTKNANYPTLNLTYF